MLFHFYGLLLGLGIALGIFFIEKLIKTPFYKKPKQYLNEVLPWILVGGLIGARAYHVIDYWDYYASSLLEILFVWQGGVGIFGAILGGVFALWLFVRFKKLKSSLFLKGLDLFAIVLALGQAIGRWGNYFNQELYGPPTNMPWGIFIRIENRLAGYELFSHFHPLFLYESLWMVFIFLILWQKIKNNKNSGVIFLMYLFLYSFGRFWLEFLRLNPWRVGLFSVGQILSLILGFSSLLGLIYLLRVDKHKNTL